MLMRSAAPTTLGHHLSLYSRWAGTCRLVGCSGCSLGWPRRPCQLGERLWRDSGCQNGADDVEAVLQLLRLLAHALYGVLQCECLTTDRLCRSLDTAFDGLLQGADEFALAVDHLASTRELGAATPQALRWQETAARQVANLDRRTRSKADDVAIDLNALCT